jgi:DNA-binding CsgD family transcriptional regulator/tetratricopeptide (TPR) repeat protein
MTALAVAKRELAEGRWAAAREAFSRALAEGAEDESAEAYEGLGMAAWWLDDARVTFESRENAYRLYREQENAAGAARMAMALAWDYSAFRGEQAIASGWLERARRLLDGLPPSAEHGWLAIRDAARTLAFGHDPVTARELASKAVELGRSLGSLDLEMVGCSFEGLALVNEGRIAEGMARLDEVTTAVVAGELRDHSAVGQAACNLISGCEIVRDYARANEWCQRLREFCDRFEVRPLSAVCRTQFAEVLMWHGAFEDAERELTQATEELETTRPALKHMAHVALAKLRLRQGQLAEADSLLAHAPPSLALAVRAELALAQGDANEARAIAEKKLRRLPEESRVERLECLDILLRAASALADRESATTRLEELERLMKETPTRTQHAFGSRAKGFVARAHADLASARRHFEDAVDAFAECGAPFEAAAARLELGATLGALGLTKESEAELERARDALLGMGARPPRREAPEPKPGPTRPADPARVPLSPRECEVLRLVAAGLTNPQIADKLCVSEHTVHRHVANILAKLDVPTRAAASAFAAAHGLA